MAPCNLWVSASLRKYRYRYDCFHKAWSARLLYYVVIKNQVWIYTWKEEALVLYSSPRMMRKRAATNSMPPNQRLLINWHAFYICTWLADRPCRGIDAGRSNAIQPQGKKQSDPPTNKLLFHVFVVWLLPFVIRADIACSALWIRAYWTCACHFIIIYVRTCLIARYASYHHSGAALARRKWRKKLLHLVII
jgi:hypothetical protein